MKQGGTTEPLRPSGGSGFFYFHCFSKKGEEDMMREMYAEEGAPAAQNQRASDGRKNVLLIGDSIRMGYCQTVRQELSDVANVFFPEENCRDTHYVMTSMRAWLNLCPPEDVDLVQFNCGHWDIAHWNGEEQSLTSLPQYAESIGRIIEQLRRNCPHAQIVFATTTPMNPDGSMGVNPRSTEEIRRYNDAARAVAQEKQVIVLDLFAQTADWGTEDYADYCHYTPAAFERLGRAVAGFLRQVLTGQAG